MARLYKCGKCGLAGHNARTCTFIDTSAAEARDRARGLVIEDCVALEPRPGEPRYVAPVATVAAPVAAPVLDASPVALWEGRPTYADPSALASDDVTIWGGSRASAYQVAVLRFVALGTGNAVVRAVPGSGKSTTIVEAARYLRGLRVMLPPFLEHLCSAYWSMFTDAEFQAESARLASMLDPSLGSIRAAVADPPRKGNPFAN